MRDPILQFSQFELAVVDLVTVIAMVANSLRVPAIRTGPCRNLTTRTSPGTLSIRLCCGTLTDLEGRNLARGRRGTGDFPSALVRRANLQFFFHDSKVKFSSPYKKASGSPYTHPEARYSVNPSFIYKYVHIAMFSSIRLCSSSLFSPLRCRDRLTMQPFHTHAAPRISTDEVNIKDGAKVSNESHC